MSRTRPWTQATGFFTLASYLMSGCGVVAKAPSETYSEVRDVPAYTTETKALSNWRQYPALSLRSAWQNFSKNTMKLEVGLNWVGFGAEVQALTHFRLVTDGSIELVKHISSRDSKIFRDENGTIAVTHEEPVSARCEYESEALFMLEGGGTLMVGGVEVEHSRGETKILEVTTTGNTFEVPDGATLASLETLCRGDFESVMRPIVERSLVAGLKSKLRIEKFDDSRLNALRQVLRDQEASLEHLGMAWVAEPVSLDQGSEALTVKGRVRQSSGWRSRSYDYQFSFDRATHRMTQIDISPRGVDQVSQGALELAAFLARNAAEKEFAQDEGRPFVIDAEPISKSS